jgi:hypothetical protein
VIVDNLNIFRVAAGPHKADPELVIDPDRMLPWAVTLERLQFVAGRTPQIAQRFRRIQHDQLSTGDPDQIGWETFARIASLKNRLGSPVPKASACLPLRRVFGWISD